MQTAIQQMIDFINDINDNDRSEFNYYYDSIIAKLNELLEVEKQQISGAPELRYKDGTSIRKYNSPKLQAIEMENKQTAVDWLIEQLTPSISLQQKHIDELKEKAKEMENKTMTAVQWLYNKMYQHRGNITIEEYEQAKQMEKEQIINAWIATDNELQRIAAEQYYNDTYGKK